MTHRARNNALVLDRYRTFTRLFALAIMLVGAIGCTDPATEFVDKIQAEATQKCNEGNQAACHTIVQQVSDTRVLMESTIPIETETPKCMAGQQDSCQQLAVLHSELSSWCTMGNTQACGAVSSGPWPTRWDEPALIDAAKFSCLSGKFKPDSHTCQALEMM